MARLSDEKIAQIKEEYAKVGTYSGVAKKLGVSASTVKKYVMPERNESAALPPLMMTTVDLYEWIADYVMPPEAFDDENLLLLDEDEKKEIQIIIEELRNQ